MLADSKWMDQKPKEGGNYKIHKGSLCPSGKGVGLSIHGSIKCYGNHKVVNVPRAYIFELS